MTSTTERAPVDYTAYLDSHLWPSDSHRQANGVPALQHAEDFPPQRAASCLAKLIRWARDHADTVSVWNNARQVAAGGGSGPLLDEHMATLYVRQSYLGQTLSARALNMAHTDELHAVHHDPDDALPPRADAEIQAILVVVYESLVRDNPMANPADLARVAGTLTGALIERFTIQEN